MLVVADVQVTIIHHTVVEVSAEAETETEHRVKMEPAVAAVVQMVLQEPLTMVEKVAMVFALSDIERETKNGSCTIRFKY